MIEYGPLQNISQKLEQLQNLLEQPFPQRLPPLPYTVISPLGITFQQELLIAMNRFGIFPIGKESLSQWALAASLIYVRSHTAQALNQAIRYEHLWLDWFPENRAEIWYLSDADELRLRNNKSQIRNQLPTCKIAWNGQNYNLHAFHLADPGSGSSEFQRLNQFLQ